MNITIMGTGYVGLVTGACLAAAGHRVVCFDVDAAKVQRLRRSEVPFFEPELEPLVARGLAEGKLSFTDDTAEALSVARIIFLTVGTPTGPDGGSDLSGVYAVARAVGAHLDHPAVLVTKSTVPVGTSDRVAALVSDELDDRGLPPLVTVVNNPEFLREGSAVHDFRSPDRVVLGGGDALALALLRELYQPFLGATTPVHVMDVRSSEMTKYASNAMLAARISFMNEVAGICEAVGADIGQVRLGMASDPRIGGSFLAAGTGFGGSCFPKDLRALAETARMAGVDSLLLDAVSEVNENQKKVLVRKVVERFGPDLRGLTFAVWGLAFKPDTDDLREAPSLTILNELLERGAQVRAYDPCAMEGGKRHFAGRDKGLTWASTKESALTDATALLVVTEWKEFREATPATLTARLRPAVVFDGRNLWDRETLAAAGVEYHPVGAPPLRVVQNALVWA